MMKHNTGSNRRRQVTVVDYRDAALAASIYETHHAKLTSAFA